MPNIHTQVVITCLFAGLLSNSNGEDATTKSKTRLTMWQTLSGHEKRVEAIRFLPDGKGLISLDQRGRLLVWNVESSNQIQEIQANSIGTQGLVTVSPDGKSVAICSATFEVGRIRIWDLTSAKQRWSSKDFRGIVQRLKFTPDCEHLVISRLHGDLLNQCEQNARLSLRLETLKKEHSKVA